MFPNIYLLDLLPTLILSANFGINVILFTRSNLQRHQNTTNLLHLYLYFNTITSFLSPELKYYTLCSIRFFARFFSLVRQIRLFSRFSLRKTCLLKLSSLVNLGLGIGTHQIFRFISFYDDWAKKTSFLSFRLDFFLMIACHHNSEPYISSLKLIFDM